METRRRVVVLMISNCVAAFTLIGALLSESSSFSSDELTGHRAIGIGNQVIALFEARKRWAESSVSSNHSFEFMRSCFCEDNMSVHRLIVRNGIVSAVEVVSQYRHSETARLETYPTMGQLFDQIGELT